jgi:cellulose synthase/poly-beta-1,6-N-acetylglucosamine synthase-like glycosyltransferase
MVSEWIFWVLLGSLVYTYLGYALLLWLFRRPAKQLHAPIEFPHITHIIAAYNEEEEIVEKIRNTLAIRYPGDRIRHIVVTDGSTDGTAALVAEAAGITHLHQAKREGKVAALNRAVAAAGVTDVLVFSDANAMLNPDALKHLVAHLQDPAVGGVAGEKRVMAQGLVPGKAEGIYWTYESRLKQLDADFHTVVGAAGELFAVRRELYESVPEEVLLDDLFISLQVCRKGFVMAYEPRALATEAPSLSIGDEQMRRVRIGAGAFQSLQYFKDLLNPFRYGKLSFQFFSHRVMRWLVCPFALPLIFLLNFWVLFHSDNSLYLILFIAQILFYLLSWVGASVARRQKGSGIFLLPFYFVFMNASLVAGLFRYLSGNQTVRWEKSKRAVLR